MHTISRASGSLRAFFLLRVQESATALATEEKERDRVAAKYEAYVSKSSHSGKTMPEIRESTEYKKLAKKMQVGGDVDHRQDGRMVIVIVYRIHSHIHWTSELSYWLHGSLLVCRMRRPRRRRPMSR